MPYLKQSEFTEAQADEIRAEIHLMLQPYRIRFWFILVGFLIAVTLGALAWQSTQSNKAIRATEEAHVGCVQSHVLVSDVVLRSIGTTYAMYKANPQLVLAKYRKTLEGNAFYKANPELIASSIKQTADVLKLSDPARCP